MFGCRLQCQKTGKLRNRVNQLRTSDQGPQWASRKQSIAAHIMRHGRWRSKSRSGMIRGQGRGNPLGIWERRGGPRPVMTMDFSETLVLVVNRRGEREYRSRMSKMLPGLIAIRIRKVMKLPCTIYGVESSLHLSLLGYLLLVLWNMKRRNSFYCGLQDPTKN